ncbi:MAG: DJ-1 family glyoxalase III [Candidatus Kapaibacterium sp.]
MKKTALVTIAHGTEEIEAVTIIDVLRRASVSVRTAGANDIVTCSRGIKIIPDVLLDNIDRDELFDAIVLPGGMQGMENLTANYHLAEIISNHIYNGRLICAICAAPVLLADHKFLPENARITSHPSVRPQLKRFDYSDDRVVEHENLITSRGPGTAMEFALAIVRRLAGEEISEKLAKDMIHQ